MDFWSYPEWPFLYSYDINSLQMCLRGYPVLVDSHSWAEVGGGEEGLQKKTYVCIVPPNL